MNAPFALSKSAAKAAGCELYFRRRYLTDGVPPMRAAFGAEVATQFHHIGRFTSDG